MTRSVVATVDEARAEAFAGRLFELFTSGMLTYMIDIGDRTGLLRAAALGPTTSDELANRAGLHERYVREWLGATVTGGIIDYDPSARTYRLPAETPDNSTLILAEAYSNRLTAGLWLYSVRCPDRPRRCLPGGSEAGQVGMGHQRRVGLPPQEKPLAPRDDQQAPKRAPGKPSKQRILTLARCGRSTTGGRDDADRSADLAE